MLTLEQLNALRGIKTPDKPKPAASPATPQTAPQQTQKSVSEPQKETANIPDPVAIPCKNYNDEQGHFAYIDANTNLPKHVNLTFDKKYTQDEVNYLSFKYAVRNMSDAEKQLTWQQVVTKDTVYDQFGSPIFTEEEIKRAVTNPQIPTTPSFVTPSGKDAFGLK